MHSAGSGRVKSSFGMKLYLRSLNQKYLEHVIVALTAFLLVSLCCLTEPSLFSSVDFVLFYKQNFMFIAEAVKEMRVPLWNPYIGLGRPFLADIQNAIFYPPTYLVLFGPKSGALLLVWLHAYWLALGMKQFGCAIGMKKWIGYAAGLVFFLSGVCMGRLLVGQIMFVCGMSYIPWLLFYATRVEGAPIRTIGQYAGLLSLQFLTGHPQVFWLTAIAQVIFLIVRSFHPPLFGSLGLVCRNVTRFALAMVWAGLIVAVVLFPFIELVHHGNRSTATGEFVAYGVMDDWVKFFALFAEPPRDYFVGWEQNVFVGLGALVAGISGLVQIRSGDMRGLLGILLIATVIAVGNQTPAFGVFHYIVPGFKSFRLHSRANILIVFVIVCAAGIWLSHQHKTGKSLLVLAVIGVIVAGLIFTFYPYQRSAGGTLPIAPLLIQTILATTICALWVTIRTPPYRSLVCLGLVGLVLSGLAGSILYYKKLYKFETVMQFSPEYPLRNTVLEHLNLAANRESGLPPRSFVPWPLIPQNDGMIHHYSNCDAYTSLFLNRPWRYIHDLHGVPVPSTLNTFLSVDVYRKAYPHLAIDVGFDFATQTVVSHTNRTPRAFVVFAATNVSDAASAIAHLRDGWNIYEIGLTETRLTLPTTNTARAEPSRVTAFTSNEIEMDVTNSRNGLLVLAETWYPGWKLAQQGKTVDSVVVNGWMRAFPLSPGTKRVRVFYRQNYLGLGLFITTVALALLVYSQARPHRNSQLGYSSPSR
jgi:hypothetical protein